ncbi:MAG: hypothetical protein MJ169_08755 [Treponema sp.]|nr:hypothetical protein [Treponema sp.]
MDASKKSFYIDKFIRNYPSEFTIKEFMRFLNVTGEKVTKEEAEEILEASPYIFVSGKKSYLTHAGAFSLGVFSFMPSQEEVEAGAFVPGHRCIPFTDFDMYSFDLTFVFGEKKLKKVRHEFSREFALENFVLYGEEFEVQYIASDPAMNGYSLSDSDFELPARVNLSCFDFNKIKEEYGFSYGDRFECMVTDWDKGIVEIVPVIRGEKLQVNSGDLGRTKWNHDFEKALINIFNEMGPCATIDQQLAFVFLNNKKELMGRNCSSVIEYLSKSKVVDFEFYGVETRLWFKGKDVPAFGPWNQESGENEIFCKPANLKFNLPEFILDEFIKDFIFEKRQDFEELIEIAFPQTFYIPPEDRQELILHIINRSGILKKEYNLFADQPVAEIRHKALELYSKVNEIVYNIDRNCAGFETYPQQELVILIQLYTHTTKMLESIAFETAYVKAESGTMMASLEGMCFHFEEIEPNLKNAIETNKKEDFTVI